MKLRRLCATALFTVLSMAAGASADPSVSVTVGGQPAGQQVNIQSLSDLQVLVSTPDGAVATTTIDLLGGTQGQVPIDQRAAPVGLTAPVAASITGGAGNFTITRDTCTGVALGGASSQSGSCVIEVTPKANTFGHLNGTLRLSVGDYQKEVTLTGNAHDFEPARLTIAAAVGNPALMTIVGPGRPAYSSPVTLRITNASREKESAPIGFVLNGNNAANFEVTADACTGKALAPLGSCDISVRSLASQPVSSFSTTLNVSANNNPSVTLAGSASGWKPASLVFVATNGSGVDVKGPGSPAYGQPVAFSVQNTGDLISGAISTVLLSTANFELYGANTCTGATLDAAQSCVVSVRSKASANAALSTTLRVTQSGATTDLPISGNATGFNPAKLILASGSSNGIDIPNGSSPGGCRDFGFRNDGDLTTGTLSSSITSGATNFSTSGCTNSCSNTLAGGQNCSVGVRLVASANGTYSGNLRVAANPGGQIDVPLAGSASGFCVPTTQRTGESGCSASCGGGQKTVYWSNGCGSTWTTQESCNQQSCTPPPTISWSVSGSGQCQWMSLSASDTVTGTQSFSGSCPYAGQSMGWGPSGSFNVYFCDDGNRRGCTQHGTFTSCNAGGCTTVSQDFQFYY